ncbi:MAG: TRAP transporter large permease, partial [Vulcanimicrobiaceae bacterium]
VAIASLMIPIMRRNGYPPPFAAAVVASSGSLGPIIPPSIPMVIYASIVPSVSIAALFVGGIVPGVMIAISFLTVVWIFGGRLLGSIPQPSKEVTGTALSIVLKFLPATVIPVLILYGVIGGVVTVTESATLAVVYALGYGLVTRRLTRIGFTRALHNTVLFTGLVGIIIAAAGPFSFFLALYRAPEAIGHLLLALSGGNIVALMLILIAVLFILGCLVEATSLVIILAPILAGTATIAGINQVHMAIVAIVALMIGLFTPPVGTNLFAVVGISKQSLESVSRALIPFVISSMTVVVILAVVPSIVTFLPSILLHRPIQ